MRTTSFAQTAFQFFCVPVLVRQFFSDCFSRVTVTLLSLRFSQRTDTTEKTAANIVLASGGFSLFIGQFFILLLLRASLDGNQIFSRPHASTKAVSQNARKTNDNSYLWTDNLSSDNS